jgi:Tol biopolymer transport system component
VAALLVPGIATAQRRVAWSPDGRRVAFTTEGKDTSALYLANADGAGRRRLFSSGTRESYPDWSPDGRRILFVSDSGGHSDIYVREVDGTGLRALTHEAGRNSWPSWSPDGRQIAFMSDRTGKWQLFIMHADGSDPRRLTHTATNEFNPEWWPDGRRLVFESTRNGGGKDDIYSIDVASGRETRLTAIAANAIFPAVSPDGTRIAFCTVADRRATLMVMNADGSKQQTLLQDGCVPQWAPGGERIAFDRQSAAAGPGIYIVTLKSGTVTLLARWAAGSAAPRRRPRGACTSRPLANRSVTSRLLRQDRALTIY